MPETPEVLKNVYRDLRDRRLLSIAIVLVIAIIAVPFLVKSDAEGPAASSTVASAPVEEAEVLDPAVLTEEPVLRDFRKRLDRYRDRDPFVQQLTGIPGGGLKDLSAEDGSSSDSTSAGTGGSTDAVEGLSEGLEPIDDSTMPPAEGSEVPPDSGDGVAEGEGESEGGVLVTTRVDVRIGTVGKTEVIENVKPLDFLPDRQGAVVEYLQSDFDLTHAVFIVSPFVTSSEGDGKCAPSPQRCEFVQLDVGEEHSFQYDGQRYRLKLLDTYLQEEPVKDGDVKGSRSEAEFSAGAPSGQISGG